MKTLRARLPISLLPFLAALAVAPAGAQAPVDGSGMPLADFESFEPEGTAGNEDIPLLTHGELQALVGPIALYPDDLLAIVLPASTYPLQLVQAQRFLEDLEEDPSLKPDESWDDSVIALLNYPEVVELLNRDLDWTWRLGEAVVAQQTDVVGAVESFRERAYAAGNLESDAHQTVARNAGAIEITPVEDDVIYVPYYEPERVVVHQTRPVYHYYPLHRGLVERQRVRLPSQLPRPPVLRAPLLGRLVVPAAVHPRAQSLLLNRSAHRFSSSLQPW
jgi:hypothetical protein